MLTTPRTNWTQLDNGVRVITERVEGSASTALSVLVDAGPQDEEQGQNGLAHLCEHACFLGTPLRSSQELAMLIDTAGGYFGAFTAPDYTCFNTHVLTDYASYAIDLLGDILVASQFPDGCIEKEKEVVCQEIAGHHDSADTILLQATKQNLWPGDALAKPTTGSIEDVRSLNRSDVMQFVSRQYTPDRLIVAVAGSLDHDSIVEQVQDAFWPLRGQSIARNLENAKVAGGLTIATRQTSQCGFSIAVPCPNFQDKRRYTMHVLSNLIGGGMSSRLYQTLRDTYGLVYSIQSSILAYRRGGMFSINGATLGDNLVRSVSLVLIQLMALATWENPIEEEELWKSKMQVRSQSRLTTELVSNRVARIATQEFYLNKRIDDDEIIDAIDAVTIDDLKSLAAEVLLKGMSQLSIAVVGPLSEDDNVCSELRDIFDSFRAVNG